MIFQDFYPVFAQKIPKNFQKILKNILFYKDLAQELAQNKQQDKEAIA